MDVKIHPSWKKILSDEFEKTYFKDLVAFVKSEYQKTTIYPPPKDIFRAFDMCSFDEVKVVILGQDPYHGEGQANGLCFAVYEGVRQPPSLQNIFKELKADIGKSHLNSYQFTTIHSKQIQNSKFNTHNYSSNLESWARQGILLLNATLTVRKDSAGSHQGKGWETFTDAVVKKLSDEKEHLVFLLWGNYAKQKGAVIDRTKHLVLETAHPSPFSADKGFFGCKHFSKTNNYLEENHIEKINWL